MKRLPILVSLCFLMMASVVAQSGHGLSFTGSVQKLSTTCIGGEQTATVQVYLQFRNDSKSTLLLLSPDWLTREVSFGTSEGRMVSAELLRNDPFKMLRERDEYDYVPGLIGRLDFPDPRSVPIVLFIEPGGYYEFNDTIWSKTGFKIDTEPTIRETRRGLPKSPCKVVIRGPVAEYSTLKLRYHLSLKKHAAGEDLFEKLQTWWRPFGNFVLDSNKDVSFETEDILIPAGK